MSFATSKEPEMNLTPQREQAIALPYGGEIVMQAMGGTAAIFLKND
jgi:hypothetical protein